MNVARQPCWHCAAPVRGKPFVAHTPEGDRLACCGGCAAAIESIHSLGLADYYRFRTEPSPTPEVDQDSELHLSLFDLPDLIAPFIKTTDGITTFTLRVDGLHCAACVWLIERALGDLPGMQSVRLNLASGRLTTSYQSDHLKPVDIARRLHQLGYSAHLPTRDARLQQEQKAHRQMLRRLLVAALCSMQAMMYSTALYLGSFDGLEWAYEQLFRHVSFIVATPAVFYSGWPFFSGAWYSIKARTLTMDVPVALALGLAWVGSVVALLRGEGHIYFESLAMFVFFLLISRWLLQRQNLRVAESHSRLVDTLPAIARRRTDDQWQPVPAAVVRSGDHLEVQQGELIPADGEIITGQGWLEEAILTGESRPREARVGSQVLAGSRLVEGLLEIRATSPVDDSMLARLGRLLEDSADRQSRLHLYASAVVPWFILGVIFLAAFTVYLHREAGIAQGLEYALAVLVVTCPCALALAVPLAISAAQSNALTTGVLIARPLQLLQLMAMDTVMFDKTGTLTTGEFRITGTRHLDKRFDASLLHAVAAGLEQQAIHPLARAIADLADPVSIEGFRQARTGVSGHYHGDFWQLRAAPDYQDRFDTSGNSTDRGTIVVLLHNEHPVYLFQLADTLRDDAAQACESLVSQSCQLLLASGDNSTAVARVAAAVGITNWQANMTPEGKSQWLSEQQQAGHQVLMTGDGVNDAPALAAADASVAMAHSAAMTRDAAGFYLLKPNLMLLPRLIALSKRTRTTLRWNIVWALGYNLLAIPFAVAGLIPPWLAAIGMSLSSLIVTTNAARLSRWNLSQWK